MRSSILSLVALAAAAICHVPCTVAFVPMYRLCEQRKQDGRGQQQCTASQSSRRQQQQQQQPALQPPHLLLLQGLLHHQRQAGAALSRVLRMTATDDDDETGWVAPKSAMIGGAGVNNAGEPPFEIRGFSLGNLVIAAGVLITLASFAEYLSETEGGLNVSGLGFVYGIPIFLAGAALKYAEIEPVPVYSTAAAEALFEEKATETLRKIKQDVTRHRYGDEAHLDTTVKKLGLVVPGKDYPQLQELRQEKTENGELAFTMVWQSIDTPYKMWADERRIKKYEAFFGPGVTADVVKIDAEQRLVGIRLTTKTKETAAAASTAAAPSSSSTAATS